MGALLRLMFFDPPAGLNFKNILHAHSHTALLGWLYSALFAFIIYYFLPSTQASKPKYKWLFGITQVAVLGMLFSFPVQGYGPVSISFSTLHILASYGFIYFFLKDLKKTSLQLNEEKKPLSLSFIKAGLFFMALSSLGPWSLGPVMAMGFGGTPLYYLPIYFYLHFQYNGWFTFAVFGLLFKFLERNNIEYPKVYARQFFRWMLWACIPSYLLSALWVQPPLIVYIIAGIAAIMQFVAIYWLVKLVVAIKKDVQKRLNSWISFLVGFAVVAFILKILLQLVSALPAIAELAYKNRNFIIGYLHLTLIGFISFFVLALLIKEKGLKLDKIYSKAGMVMFIFGFFASEFLLFLQATLLSFGLGNVPYYFELMFWLSIPMPVGLIFFLANQFSLKLMINSALRIINLQFKRLSNISQLVTGKADA